ncbi:MAG: 3'(2'),5'-bisphosphate nucleotidase CysQ [Cyanobacteriota bacterium]|nr:3'(2'),5'-bisphosphate nucleotidase CysQ [Cyanobacteriota bacterium]
MFSSEELGSLRLSMVRLAEQAGQGILQVYAQADLGITHKTDDSPLTQADLVSHHTIVEGLQNQERRLPILSEESQAIPYQERQPWSAFWLVDPLDGTKEFIQRNGQFTVNIALIEEGIPILGVVHAPVLSTTYSAARGGGAFKQASGQPEQPIRVADYPVTPCRVVASRSHAGSETTDFLERLRQTVGEVSVVSMGSSLKFCLVAEGSAHLYPRFGPTMEWDTAAAHAIVQEAGGEVTTLQGDPLRYNKPDLLNPYFMVFGNPVAGLWPALVG